MIKDKCDIIYNNDVIEQEVTIPCPDNVIEEPYCEDSYLLNGLCITETCPEGYSDNGSNCKKEVSSYCNGFIAELGRFWTGAAFGSRMLFINCATGEYTSPINFFPSYNLNDRISKRDVTIIYNNITYNTKISSNLSSNDTQWDLEDDIFSNLVSNSSFTYPMQRILVGTADIVIWNNQTYTKNTSRICPEGATKVNDKCFKYENKIIIQETPLIKTRTVKRKALPQIVKVNKGETTSDISKKHANFLANQLLKKKIQNLSPLCEEIKLEFFNDRLEKVGTKPCSYGTPCEIKIVVEAGKFKAETKEDANNLAQQELDRLFNLSVPCCLPEDNKEFLSDSKTYIFQKSCTKDKIVLELKKGGNYNFKGINIPKFSSIISLNDANSQRDNWFNSNKELFENLILCPEQECDSEIIVKTTQKLRLTVNIPYYTFERFDDGSFINDIEELKSQGIVPHYLTTYCTKIPVYNGYEQDITEAGGAVITNLEDKKMTISYTTSGVSFINGIYNITFKIKVHTFNANKIFKYGDESCC